MEIDLQKYDIFLFDMYGVIWDGKMFFDGAKDVLKKLKNNNKIVYILSNTTAIGDQAKENLNKKLMEVDSKIGGSIYYDDYITSGDVFRDAVLQENLDFKKKKKYKNVYIFGKKNESLFNNTVYELVDDLYDADFVYISVPQLSEKEYNLFNNKKILKEAPNKNIEIRIWDSLSIDPFLLQLEEFKKRNLPIVNANPDLVAAEVDINGEINFVIRQGSIAEIYRNMFGEVVEFGKPNENIYNFTFEKIRKNIKKNIDKERIIMIGDTLRTDIKGANNVGIDSILLTETGITFNELRTCENLEYMMNKYDARPTYCINAIKNLLYK